MLPQSVEFFLVWTWVHQFRKRSANDVLYAVEIAGMFSYPLAASQFLIPCRICETRFSGTGKSVACFIGPRISFVKFFTVSSHQGAIFKFFVGDFGMIYRILFSTSQRSTTAHA